MFCFSVILIVIYYPSTFNYVPLVFDGLVIARADRQVSQTFVALKLMNFLIECWNLNNLLLTATLAESGAPRRFEYTFFNVHVITLHTLIEIIFTRANAQIRCQGNATEIVTVFKHILSSLQVLS